MPSTRRAPAVDLHRQPGFHIRRLQQIAVALFLAETRELGLTPVQYAALQTVADQPGIDQRTLAEDIAFDTSTIAGVIDRLEARGLLERQVDPRDRRLRRLAITDEGDALLAAAVPGMQRAQQRMLAPLRSRAERETFMRLLLQLVAGNNQRSRAPRVERAPDTPAKETS